MDLAEALDNTFEEVSYYSFYRDLFPVGSFEEKGVWEKGKYNGIAISIALGGNHIKRYTVTDDLDVISELADSDDFCLMSPISYAGKTRKSEYARFLYALAIDLDGIETIEQWQFFMTQIERGDEMLSFVWGLPCPTYLVSSGTGIHIYYVFENAIPLFKNIVKQLEVLKKRLTWQAWTQGASSLHDNVQYESLFQGFRMVGTITKTGERCRAFKVGNKVTVEYLNGFVPAEYQVKSFAYKSELPLKKAAELYPEWYQSRIIENSPRRSWTCNKAVYDWWIRTLSAGAEQGHRYWCILALAAYAVKCGVPRETLEKDAFDLIPLMNTKGDAFTEDDVIHALAAYTDSYVHYPIDTIVYRTGIPIQKNKRNGRKQADHVKLMNFVRDELNHNVNWREGNGRPKGSGTAANKVYEWRQQHPDGKKIECERETGMSRHTVLKWWDYVPPKKVNVLEAPFSDVQQISMDIVSECQRIAAEQNISEEEAYELYKQDNRNVQLVKPMSKREQLQEELDKLIFSESEYAALPYEFKSKVFAMGLKPRIVPDDEYEIAMAEEFFRGLKK